MEKSKIVGEIQKNSIDRIRIAKRLYQGREYVDIRVFYEVAGGEVRPTKKGVTLGADKIDDLIRLLENVKKVNL